MINLKTFSQSAYSTYGMIEKTYEISKACLTSGIDGAFVECGVAAGAQVGVMAYMCKLYNDQREIHLYDSFEGIPLAGPKDTQQPGIGPITHDVNVSERELLKSSGITVHGIQQVKDNMKRWGVDNMNLVYHKGWFQDTLPNNTIDKIAILRLDGDLYESNKVCLEYLGHKVVKGGYIIIDDYSLVGAQVAVHEYIDKNKLDVELIKIYDGVHGGNTGDENQVFPVYWIVK
jgi:O-methyltransferase